MLFASLLLTLIGCGQSTEENSNVEVHIPNTSKLVTNDSKKEGTQSERQYQTVEWTDLIPKSDLAALLDPPDYIVEIEDGSIEDQIASSMNKVMNNNVNENNPYEKALISTNVISDFDQTDIKIPGFVVPVVFNDEQMVKSFFLVPYFGACLHLPPPPPNQIIYVEVEKGLKVSSLYEPIWVMGTLSVELFEDQIATSAYTMKMNKMEVYDVNN